MRKVTNIPDHYHKYKTRLAVQLKQSFLIARCSRLPCSYRPAQPTFTFKSSISISWRWCPDEFERSSRQLLTAHPVMVKLI